MLEFEGECIDDLGICAECATKFNRMVRPLNGWLHLKQRNGSVATDPIAF